MNDIRCQDFYFTKLKHMSSRVIGYNWSKTSLDIAMKALRQIEWTWRCFVTVYLKSMQDASGNSSEKLSIAHDLYMKCKDCIQHRIDEIMAATKTKGKNWLTPDHLFKHGKNTSSSVEPMIKIPIPIVVDLLKDNNNNNVCLSTHIKGKSRAHKDANVVNEQQTALTKFEFVCVRCTKPIKNTIPVDCNDCQAKSHFGCLRRAKLVRTLTDTLWWKCQKCLKCHCCDGTSKSVRKISRIDYTLPIA